MSRRDVAPELAASRLRLLLTWQADNIERSYRIPSYSLRKADILYIFLFIIYIFTRNFYLLFIFLHEIFIYYLYFYTKFLFNRNKFSPIIGSIRVPYGFTIHLLLIKCGTNVLVNMVYVTPIPKYEAFIYYCGNVTYTIFTYTFAPHLNSSKYIVNPNFHTALQLLTHWK